MTTDEYVQRLTETSKKKYSLIQDILLLTKTQTNTITEDSISELERLIAEKQIKIDSIDKLDDEFNVYFQRLKQTLKIKNLDELKGSDIRGIKELQETISGIMSGIKGLV